MSARRPKVTSERIAVLETQVDGVLNTQEAILAKQDQILQELSRYRGMFGAALLIISAIGTALMFFKEAILLKFGLKS